MREPTDEQLEPFGWMVGDYVVTCKDCRKRRAGSKRSIRCYDCAVATWHAAQTPIPASAIGPSELHTAPDPDASRYHHVRRALSAALGLTKAEIDGLVDRQRAATGSEEVEL